MEGSVSPNGINELFTKYLDAWTDVCKAGIQLAGKLDQHMQTREYAAYKSKQLVSTVTVSSAIISVPDPNQPCSKDLMEFYSNILTKMTPLWFLTFQRADEGLSLSNNTVMGDGMAIKQCQRLESIGESLVSLHKSIAINSQTFLPKTTKQSCDDRNIMSSPSNSSGHQKNKTPLARKVSPCIVITDTERHKRIERHASLSPTESRRTQPEISKSHVPTDDDMSKIINFLSSTYTPLKHHGNSKPLQSAHPGNSGNIRHSDSNPELFRKQPLSIQRSSPLPGLVHQQEVAASNLSSSTKHHSDWQIYSNIQKKENPYPPTCREAYNQYPTQQPQLLKPPFAAWSLANSASRNGTDKDFIWAHDSAASSGDESHSCNTDQLFTDPRLDLTSVVNSTRRSSYDSTASSQTFDTSTFTDNSSVNLTTTNSMMTQNESCWLPSYTWSTNTSNMVSSDHSTRRPESTGAALYHDYQMGSIWSPVGGVSSLQPSQKSLYIGASIPSNSVISAESKYHL